MRSPQREEYSAPLYLTATDSGWGTTPETAQPGMVVLAPKEQQTEVLLAIQAERPGPQPAHIHRGDCRHPEGVQYPLAPVTFGRSSTMVNTSLPELVSGRYALTVHLGPGAEAVHVTFCLNLGGATPVMTLPQAGSGGWLGEEE